MAYLIVRCDELNDQYECSADRTPITLTDNWKLWYEKEKPTYSFEVYQFIKKSFTKIKSYDSFMESGMCLAYYPNDCENAVAIKKYPKYTRHDVVPKDILKRALKGEDFDDYWLKSCGYVTWLENGTLYCWTEYNDNTIYNCY